MYGGVLVRHKAILKDARRSDYYLVLDGLSGTWKPLLLHWILPIFPIHPNGGLCHLPGETPFPRTIRPRRRGKPLYMKDVTLCLVFFKVNRQDFLAERLYFLRSAFYASDKNFAS